MFGIETTLLHFFSHSVLILFRFGCHYLVLSVLLNVPTIGMGLSETLLNHVSIRSGYTCMSCAPGHPVVYCLQLTPENRINLLRAVESCESTPDVLVNIFTEAAIAGLDELNEKVSAVNSVRGMKTHL